jgi:ParB-like chromosome segregation protein Spo0J
MSQKVQLPTALIELGSLPPLRCAELAGVGFTVSGAEMVEMSALSVGESPRSGGEDVDHTAVLMECETTLPPILVHRPSMQIIDGHHRFRAAQAKGETAIEAVLLDGTAEAAFVISVAFNLSHGLPLSMQDRRRAAARIVNSHPQWSDRSISRLVGLSAKTVKTIRTSTIQLPTMECRTGRDGRVRPVDAGAGRRAAAEYLTAHPQSSLRTVAKYAGISPNTVRDVRNRMKRGEDPAQFRSRATPAAGRPPATPSPARRTPAAASKSRSTRPISEASCTAVRPLVASLSRDPAIRMTDSGRELLRWLHFHMVEDVDVTALLAATPGHRQPQVAEIAARCAVNWAIIADKMSPHTPARDPRRIAADI